VTDLILENQELMLNNLISLRKKMTQQEMTQELQKIGQIIKENNATKCGPIITSTFAIEQGYMGQVMDIEILIPVDKELSLGNSLNFKKQFCLINALKISHIGNPSLLQNTYNELNKYINDNNLQTITSAYAVTVKDIADISKIDEAIVDIYIGINPNIV
jgi:effector-binding domain-containing protein